MEVKIEEEEEEEERAFCSLFLVQKSIVQKEEGEP